MAEPRFNNPYFWPPPPAMPGQLDNLVLINKIKEQLMAEKIRPPHLPPASAPSQQPLLATSSHSEGGQHGISKAQQMPVLHNHSPSQPDIALHARPASSSVTGRILGDVNLNLDDKAAIKARGLWEDWHLRQLIDHPSRTNHVSGCSATGNHSMHFFPALIDRPVNKKSFLQHVEDLCANDNAKFQEEFAELPKLLQDLATTDADLPWNKSKNRFPNIKPYNNNRVKLLSEPGTAGSDYINASFVSGYLCPNEFIATQGPLPGTVADFWRMIWETGTRTIAMLTHCYEKGRIRCHKYWPEDNKPMSVFSDILISKVSEEVFPDWTIRTLKVEKHGHYILVRHFNYTSWPEHGVPESCSTLIKFVKAVRMHRQDNSTIVVHCSAGVGRTGVFIALDHLIQHVRDHDFVDIYGLVAELRSERMCMVQNLAQYIFLHQSTLELLNNKGNSQSIWFVSYSALEKMDSLDAMEGDVELEWEETTM